MKTAYITALTQQGETNVNVIRDGKKYYYNLKTENTLLILLYVSILILLEVIKK